MNEKYVKGYFALSHLLVSQRLVLSFNKSSCFSKMIRNTEDRLQYASSDEIFFWHSVTWMPNLKNFISTSILGPLPWVSSFSSWVLNPEFGFWGPGILGPRAPSTGSESESPVLLILGPES